MSNDTKQALEKASQLTDIEKKHLFFNTATLSRFMRANFGPNAVAEAQRHVTTYAAAKDKELVEIWTRVVAHLCGVELKEDKRRTLKSLRASN
jgi:hypothetical protein